MKIDIKGTNMELTEAIKAHVNEKIGSLDKFFNQILEARVEIGITSKHHQKGDVFRAEVNLEVPQTHVIRAESTSDDLYKAINETKDKLKIELSKFKEKLKGI